MEYKIISKNNKRYIIIPELIEMGLNHCFTTKDMDVGIKTNKSVDDLKENFRLIYEFMNITPKMLYNGYQVHSGNIAMVTGLNQGLENTIGRYFPETDGLVTDKEDIALITRFADCTPILLFDPVKRVQANIHSGWKGTLQRIGANGVKIMVENYDSKPVDIIAVLGPAIGKDEFEVDIDVMEMFRDEFHFHNEIIRKKNDIKYLIDLSTTNKRILLEAGVLEENIITIDLTTMTNPMFHSYRRDKEDYGLMGLISVL